MTGETRRPGEELLNSALRLLAARSRGVEELRGRLQRKGFNAEEVAVCLSWLEERSLLDDAAFSRALVRDRLNFSPRASSVLRQELVRKGVARATAERVVEEVFEEEGVSEERLAGAAARSWVGRQGTSILEALVAEPFTDGREKARRRLYAFLGRRGFRGRAASRGIEAGLNESRNRLSEMI